MKMNVLCKSVVRDDCFEMFISIYFFSLPYLDSIFDIALLLHLRHTVICSLLLVEFVKFRTMYLYIFILVWKYGNLQSNGLLKVREQKLLFIIILLLIEVKASRSYFYL